MATVVDGGGHAAAIPSAQTSSSVQAFFKKFSNISTKVSRRKNGAKEAGSEGPYGPETRGQGGTLKPYMSQPVLGQLPHPASGGGSIDSAESSSPSIMQQPRRSMQHDRRPSAVSRTQNAPRSPTATTVFHAITRPISAPGTRRPSLSFSLSKIGANAAQRSPSSKAQNNAAVTPSTPERNRAQSSRSPAPKASFSQLGREPTKTSLSQPKSTVTSSNSPASRQSDAAPAAPTLPPLTLNGSNTSTMPSSSVPASTLLTPPSSLSRNGSIHRPSTPCLNQLPRPLLTRLHMGDGSARLSPSITLRTPLPILNLPTLPVPTPAAKNEPVRRQNPARLRSMPALPMAGTHGEEQADHDNAGLDEEEEEEEADIDMDDDMDNRTGHHVTSRMSMDSSTEGVDDKRYSIGLPRIDTSQLDLSFLNEPYNDVSASRSSNVRVQDERTPVASTFDYFSSRVVRGETSAPLKTPKQDDVRKQAVEPLRTPGGIYIPPVRTPGSPRPAFTHLASKSMVDLLMPTKQRDVTLEKSDTIKGKGKAKDTEAPPVSQSTAGPFSPIMPEVGIEEPASPKKSLRRQRSMPTFTDRSEPPPYPEFDKKFWRIQPRDDEGRERLPPYTNSLYLAGILPRKMEFTAPGVQAKDRKWRRVFCELDGTAFRVYNISASAAGVGVISGWWEKQVGVSDKTAVELPIPMKRKNAEIPKSYSKLDTDTDAPTPSSSSRAAVALAVAREAAMDAELEDTGRTSTTWSRSNTPMPGQQYEHPAPQKKGLASSIFHHGRSSRSQLNLPSSEPDQPRSSRASSSRRGSASGQSTQSASPPTGSTSPTSLTSSMSSSPTQTRLRTGPVQRPGSSRVRTSSEQLDKRKDKEKLHREPEPSQLLRAYTLQHAESGLGNDYLKRKNVIRVRIEGEQFLLQAQDVASVIEWIEGFQAGAGIALDLDERPMPRGPMFPRRRRRRPRPRNAEANAAPGVATSTSAPAATPVPSNS